MKDLLPDGDDLRRAVKWVSGCRQEDPELALPSLIRDAIFRFDLSPRDGEFLMRFFTRGEEET